MTEAETEIPRMPDLQVDRLTAPRERPVGRDVVFGCNDVNVFYGQTHALKSVSADVFKNHVTAFIGPSGCGKSTFIRCFDRMNDLIPSARVEGTILYHGEDMYGPGVDPVEVRKRIGMVFQKPNPFPKSIYDNIAFGPKVLGMTKDLDERVEKTLRRAALWDEVKDRLKDNAYGLSGGQQQRLCIARCIAIDPDVILMDEPCSALDPISTTAIEDLMHELKKRVHDRHRHAQHAAGGAGRRHDGVLQRRGLRGWQAAHGRPRRVRRDDEDLHESGRQADGGLRDRAVRMRIEFTEELQELRGSAAGRGQPRRTCDSRGRQCSPAAGCRARRRGDRLR